MLGPGILIWERHRELETLARQAKLDQFWNLRSCRLLREVHELLRQLPASLVLINRDLPPAEIIQGLGTLRGSKIMISLPEESRELEWPLRENGAHTVWIDRPDPDQLARSCRLCLESQAITHLSKGN